jgi:hypothetical protein
MMVNFPSPTTEPPFLREQYNLLRAVVDAQWATRLDDMVATVVIDSYSNGNSSVSLRYLEQVTGSQRSRIVGSLRKLAEHGVISVIRQGTPGRPTEYGLNFDFPTVTSVAA